jgi:hypothetical protein
MNSSQIKKFDKFSGHDGFMSENIADFPVGSPGHQSYERLAVIIADIRKFNAGKVSGFDDKAQAFSNKEDARDHLNDQLYIFNLAAKAMADIISGIENKFRLVRRANDQTLLATARSFLADAPQYKAHFIEYGLPETFLIDLENAINAFETASANADLAKTNHAEATGGLIDLFKQGMAETRKQEAIVKIKYRDTPSKLASFAVASHLERTLKKKKPEPTA